MVQLKRMSHVIVTCQSFYFVHNHARFACEIICNYKNSEVNSKVHFFSIKKFEIANDLIYSLILQVLNLL